VSLGLLLPLNVMAVVPAVVQVVFKIF